MKWKKDAECLDGERLLQGVMRRTGDSEDKIRKEMDQMWDELVQTEDPIVREFWLTIRRKGERPTAEELFEHQNFLMNVFMTMVFVKAGYSYRKARREYSVEKLNELAEKCGGADKVFQEALAFAIELRKTGKA